MNTRELIVEELKTQPTPQLAEATALIRRLHDNQQAEQLVVQERSAGSPGPSYYPAYDGNGNVAALVNAGTGALAAVYEYDPFGNYLRNEVLDAAVADNPFRFSTKYTDPETGWAWYGYRYYSPALGRFVNQDPLGEAGGLNLYAFCGNDGVNRWDYLGQLTDSFIEDNPGTIDAMHYSLLHPTQQAWADNAWYNPGTDTLYHYVPSTAIHVEELPPMPMLGDNTPSLLAQIAQADIDIEIFRAQRDYMNKAEADRQAREQARKEQWKRLAADIFPAGPAQPPRLIILGPEKSDAPNSAERRGGLGADGPLPTLTQSQIDGFWSKWGKYFKLFVPGLGIPAGAPGRDVVDANLATLKGLLAQAFLFQRPNGDPAIGMTFITKSLLNPDNEGRQITFEFVNSNETWANDGLNIQVQIMRDNGAQMLVSTIHELLHATDFMNARTGWDMIDANSNARHLKIYQLQNQTLWDVTRTVDRPSGAGSDWDPNPYR